MKTPIENLREASNQLLNSPGHDLEECVQKLMEQHNVSALDALRKHMETEAQVLIMQAEYLSVRAGCTGCGEHPHKDAVKAAERRGKRIRKAMGFTCPDRLPYRIP